jgi:acyl carrier protein
MAKFQIPLNGSNIISKDRQQAFEDALNDDHSVETKERELTISNREQQIQSSDHISAGAEILEIPQGQAIPTKSQPSPGIAQALDHTYAHQSRTMEIHQQYLSQQAEYLELITAVLEQQGKVVDQGNGSIDAGIIETFQRTLDNFHVIREQGLRVHEEFLARQADFSERYLSALEGSQHPAAVRPTASPPPPPSPSKTDAPSKWVVKELPIVLDEKSAENEPAPAPSVQKALPSPSISFSGNSSISSEELSAALLLIVADKTGYPAEMLELDMDLEADLGIDSIKRVEILGALEDEFPSLPPADTEVLSQTRTLKEIVDYMNQGVESVSPAVIAAPVQANSDNLPTDFEEKDINQTESAAKVSQGGNPSPAELTTILLEIVAEKTGYPAEMLESDMDMEADLGIDSIKRVEILGAMEEQVPGLPAVEAEALAELRTLGQIVELMSRTDSPVAEATPAAAEEKKKVERVNLENTPVKLEPLSTPDHLDFSASSERPVIITDDGTEYSVDLAKLLSEQGWKAILWQYPQVKISRRKAAVPDGLAVLIQQDLGKESIASLYQSLKEEHGLPAGFIHLHPLPSDPGLFSAVEEQLVKQIFLIAGSAKADLNHLDQATRNFFLTVTRTDGFLGLKNKQSFQEGIGLTGLVKTLNWEWPEVFCRAVDLHPGINSRKASELILQEIHDPDQGILEVGINKDSRITIGRERGSSL